MKHNRALPRKRSAPREAIKIVSKPEKRRILSARSQRESYAPQPIPQSTNLPYPYEPRPPISGRKRRTTLRLIRCPNCGVQGQFREIVYGLATEDFDFEKYDNRGCCVDLEFRYDGISCRNCDWLGHWDLSVGSRTPRMTSS
jgi:hypothetical protein